MTEKKYIVKKKIDLYEFIKAHKEEYGWNEINQACKGFRDDVARWSACWIDNCYLGGHFQVGTEYCMKWPRDMSSEFVHHLVKYGFIEEVKEEEETYKAGDILEWNHFGTTIYGMVIVTNENTATIVLMNTDYKWLGKAFNTTTPMDTTRITKQELVSLIKNHNISKMRKTNLTASLVPNVEKG